MSVVAAPSAQKPPRTPDSPLAGRRRRLALGLLACLVALVATSVASVAIGTEDVAPHEVWSALTHYTDRGNEWIVRDLRVPRTVLGIVVGVAIGLSASLIQAVTRNPLADAQVLGVNSGASLSVVWAISFLGAQRITDYLWFAFAGAMAGVVVVYLVSSLSRAAGNPVQMLLAGVALGAIMDGANFTVRLHDPRAFDAMRFWDTGALDERPLSVAVVVAPFVVVGMVLCFAVSRSLNVVAMGDDLATAMGGRLRRTRVTALVAVTLLAGAATAACGPIGFIGLMVPHIVRRLTGPDWRWIMAYSTMVGPSLLLAADVVGRLVIRPSELPAGIVTAFIGAPVLIWLIRRESARAGR